MVIHIYDVASGYSLVNTLQEHNGAVTAVCFSPCGTRLVSAGADRQLVFWRVTRTGVLVFCVHGCGTMVLCTRQIVHERSWSDALGSLTPAGCALCPDASAGCHACAKDLNLYKTVFSRCFIYCFRILQVATVVFVSFQHTA